MTVFQRKPTTAQTLAPALADRVGAPDHLREPPLFAPIGGSWRTATGVIERWHAERARGVWRLTAGAGRG